MNIEGLNIHNHTLKNIPYIMSLDVKTNRIHIDIYNTEKTRDRCYKKILNDKDRIPLFLYDSGEDNTGKCYGD